MLHDANLQKNFKALRLPSLRNHAKVHHVQDLILALVQYC